MLYKKWFWYAIIGLVLNGLGLVLLEKQLLTSLMAIHGFCLAHLDLFL